MKDAGKPEVARPDVKAARGIARHHPLVERGRAEPRVDAGPVHVRAADAPGRDSCEDETAAVRDHQWPSAVSLARVVRPVVGADHRVRVELERWNGIVGRARGIADDRNVRLEQVGADRAAASLSRRPPADDPRRRTGRPFGSLVGSNHSEGRERRGPVELQHCRVVLEGDRVESAVRLHRDDTEVGRRARRRSEVGAPQEDQEPVGGKRDVEVVDHAMRRGQEEAAAYEGPSAEPVVMVTVAVGVDEQCSLSGVLAGTCWIAVDDVGLRAAADRRSADQQRGGSDADENERMSLQTETPHPSEQQSSFPRNPQGQVGPPTWR